MVKAIKTVKIPIESKCGQFDLILGDEFFALQARDGGELKCSLRPLTILVAKLIKGNPKEWRKDVIDAFQGHRCKHKENCFNLIAKALK